MTMDNNNKSTNYMEQKSCKNTDTTKQNERENTIMLDKKVIDNVKTLSFDDIMNFWPSNRTVFREIKDNLFDIVPMIGAGLSQNITKDGVSFPTWERLLRQYAEQMGAKERAIIEWELDAGNYENAAERLADIVGERALLTYIRQEFSTDKIDIEKLKTSTIAEVVKLFSKRLILTTNYDKAIETAFNQVNNDTTFEILLPSSRKKDFVRVTKKSFDTSVLYKFHGDIDRGWEDIIFTKSSYANAYGNNEDTELDRNLSFCLLTHSILFLGCSLIRDRILNLLLDNKESYHFAFVACGSKNRNNFDCEEATVEAIRKSRELDKIGIMPIFYPRFDRTCINELHKESMKSEISKDELESPNVLYIQVAGDKECWIHDKLQKLDNYTKQIVFFGGIVSTLRKFSTDNFKTEEESIKTKENLMALKKWLTIAEDAQLYFCYDYGEAAKTRAEQVQKHKTMEETKEKIEEILRIPFAFDDNIRDRIHLIPLTYALTGYPIIIGKDLFWNIILDGRSSSASVLLVRDSAVEKYHKYMQFALDMTNERISAIKNQHGQETKIEKDLYWEYLCPEIFNDGNFKEIKNNIKCLKELLLQERGIKL